MGGSYEYCITIGRCCSHRFVVEPKGFLIHRPHAMSAAGAHFVEDAKLQAAEPSGPSEVTDPGLQDGDDVNEGFNDPNYNPFLAGIPLKLPSELIIDDAQQRRQRRSLLAQPRLNMMKAVSKFRKAQGVATKAGTYTPLLSVAYQRCRTALPWWQSNAHER